MLLSAGTAFAQKESSELLLAKENVAAYIQKKLYPNASYLPGTILLLEPYHAPDSIRVWQVVKHKFRMVSKRPGNWGEPKEEEVTFVFWLNQKMEVAIAERLN
jgi:hypothetical protein